MYGLPPRNATDKCPLLRPAAVCDHVYVHGLLCGEHRRSTLCSVMTDGVLTVLSHRQYQTYVTYSVWFSVVDVQA